MVLRLIVLLSLCTEGVALADPPSGEPDEHPLTVLPVNDGERPAGGLIGFLHPREDNLLFDGRPFLGDRHRLLDNVEFYEAVGRPDLAAEERTSRVLRWVFGAVGVGAAIAGIGMVSYGLLHSYDETYGCAFQAPDGCGKYVLVTGSSNRVLFGGFGALFGGLGIVVTSAVVRINRMTREEIQAAALRHNFGQEVPPEPEPRRRHRSAAPSGSWVVAPSLLPGGAQLGLQLTF